jgi:uncharacterized membrane protein
MVLVAAFLIDELPAYLSLDPSQARIVLREGVWLHYPVLVVHIAAGTVALVTAVMQVWPWLRNRHPVIHRLSGRVYVFGGAIPSALLALTLMPLMPAWQGNIGITMHAVLWLVTTVVGYRMVRQGRYAEHRRWMLYSFALAMGVIWGRAMVVASMQLPVPPDVNYIFEVARWFGWMVNLIIVQWWLERTSRRPVSLPAGY